MSRVIETILAVMDRLSILQLIVHSPELVLAVANRILTDIAIISFINTNPRYFIEILSLSDFVLWCVLLE